MWTVPADQPADEEVAAAAATTSTTAAPTTTTQPPTTPVPTTAPPAPDPWPPAGNPDGAAAVPAEAQAVDTSRPDHVIGDGTPASCTSAAVVATIAQGGIITFDCGRDPITITLEETARIRNDTGPEIVIDGGGKVTLSGAGERRILYMNTCDEAQVILPSESCWGDDLPHLTVQGLTFVDGNSTGDTFEVGNGGGGAIFALGGRLKVVGSRFFRNRCDPTGPDLGGAAIRVVAEPEGMPAYVVDSTFGGSDELGGSCTNGGAISGLHASLAVYNSVISHNSAIGTGANPARPGTEGGGSGGAIYTDGNNFTVQVAGTIIEDNHANEGGGAIFFVSNDRTGTLRIESSTFQGNPSDGFETAGFPGIFFLGAHDPEVVASSLA